MMKRREFLALLSSASLIRSFPASAAASFTSTAPSSPGEILPGVCVYANSFGKESQWLDLGIMAGVDEAEITGKKPCVDRSEKVVREVLLNGKPFGAFPPENRCSIRLTSYGQHIVRLRLRYDVELFGHGIPDVSFVMA